MSERLLRRLGLVAVSVFAVLVSSGGSARGIAQVSVSSGTGAWQPTSTLFAASLADFPMAVDGPPTVALDGHGRGTAVWLYSSAARREQVVMEADWTARRGWTPARTLTAFGTHVFRPPSLAVDARGDAVIAWTASDRVYASYRLPGQAWQAPRTLSGFGGAGDYARVGIDDRGRALVMWNEVRASAGAYQFTSKIVARGRRGGWGTPKVMCRCGSIAALAVNPRGLALVVWSPSRGGLWARTRSPTGRWSPRQEVSPVGTGLYYLPLALNAHGAAVVAWLEESPSGRGDQLAVAISSTHGRFGHPQLVGGDAYWGFIVAIAPTGEATVMWGDDACCLEAMTRRPGASTFTSKQVLDLGTWTTMPGTLAMDAHGSTLALWTRLDTTNDHLFMHEAQRPAGGIFNGGSDLGDLGEESYKHVACHGDPSIALSPNGRLAIAVWLARPYSNLCSAVEAATFTR